MSWSLQGIKNSLLIGILITFSLSSFAADKISDLDKISRNLKKKEEELVKKEAELKKKEDELKLLQQVLEKKEKDINKKFQKLLALYEKIKEIEDKDLDRLAKYYASTNPKSAAKIIAKMKLEKAVQLFRRMSPMAAGGILSQLGKIDPDKASKISEAMTKREIDLGKAE